MSDAAESPPPAGQVAPDRPPPCTISREGVRVYWSHHFLSRLTERFPELATRPLPDPDAIVSHQLAATGKDFKIIWGPATLVGRLAGRAIVIVTIYRDESREAKLLRRKDERDARKAKKNHHALRHARLERDRRRDQEDE